MQELSELIESAQREFAEANAAAALEDAKARYLGKTGSLTMLMKELGRLAPEERRARGQESTAPSSRLRPLSMHDAKRSLKKRSLPNSPRSPLT